MRLLYIIFFLFFTKIMFAAGLDFNFSWSEYKNLKMNEEIQIFEERELRKISLEEKNKITNEIDDKIVNFKSYISASNITEEELNNKFKFAVDKIINQEAYLKNKKNYSNEEIHMILSNAYFDIEFFLEDKLMSVQNTKSFDNLMRSVCVRDVNYDDCTKKGVKKDIEHNITIAKHISEIRTSMKDSKGKSLSNECNDIYSHQCYKAYQAHLSKTAQELKEKEKELKENKKILTPIYKSNKKRTILSCSVDSTTSEKGLPKSWRVNEGYEHSGLFDVIVYEDRKRVIIVNSFIGDKDDKDEFSGLRVKPEEIVNISDSNKSRLDKKKLTNRNENVIEYKIDYNISDNYLATYIYSINLFEKKVRVDWLGKETFIIHSSCKDANNKKYWDLAEQPLYNVEQKKFFLETNKENNINKTETNNKNLNKENKKIISQEDLKQKAKMGADKVKQGLKGLDNFLKNLPK